MRSYLCCVAMTLYICCFSRERSNLKVLNCDINDFLTELSLSFSALRESNEFFAYLNKDACEWELCLESRQD